MNSLTISPSYKTLVGLLGLVVLLAACGSADEAEESNPSLAQSSTDRIDSNPGSTSTTALSTATSTTTLPTTHPPNSGEQFDGKPITSEPIPVQPGDTVTVVVGDWQRSSVVEVGFDNRHQHLLGEPIADDDGVVTFTFELPEATPGVHKLTFDNTEGVIKGKAVRPVRHARTV